MLKNFSQTKDYLYSLIPTTKKKRFPGSVGLLRMKSLLQKLDNPQDKFPSVHIAGTAGKGSTAYLIARIMEETGYKVGLHTSPHLQTMRERLQINGRLITEKEFIVLINLIKPAIEEMASENWGRPSYFEALLAATFLYFAQQKVDLAVIEAGLGGRFDGTNVLNSKIAVITNIGLDHVEILGKTKSLILEDKMQIIKPSCLCAISGITQKNLSKILENYCKIQRVPVLFYGQDFNIKEKCLDQKSSQFNFLSDQRTIKKIKLNMPGAYQINNACLAIATCLKLAESIGFKLPDSTIKKALLKTFFPGRMEIVSQKPLIILDGAHSEDKVEALVDSIKQTYPRKKFIVVFGVKKDKDVFKMLFLLKTISNEFIITQFGQATDLGFSLNYPAEELFQIANKIMPQAKLYLEKKSFQALEKAQELAKRRKLGILLTGSLYLTGEARHFFNLTS